MDHDEKDERGNRHLQGDRQRDKDNDCVAQKVPDDGHEPAKKRGRNEQRRVRHVNHREEDRGQRGIDERNGDLRAHDGLKASIKIAEASRDLFAADGVKIILHPMSAPVRVEAGFEK